MSTPFSLPIELPSSPPSPKPPTKRVLIMPLIEADRLSCRLPDLFADRTIDEILVTRFGTPIATLRSPGSDPTLPILDRREVMPRPQGMTRLARWAEAIADRGLPAAIVRSRDWAITIEPARTVPIVIEVVNRG